MRTQIYHRYHSYIKNKLVFHFLRDNCYLKSKYYLDFSFDLLTEFDRAYQNIIVDSNVKKNTQFSSGMNVKYLDIVYI